MAIITYPVFDSEVPLEAPDEGYELAPKASAMSALQVQSQELTHDVRSRVKLTDEDSPLYGWRGIRNPLMAMLLNPKYGPVRQAMQQSLNAEFTTKHKPFVDPSRPEGYTHIVNDDDIPEQDGPVDNSKRKIEWKTNLYG